MLHLVLELAPCLLGGMALGRLRPQLPEQLAPPLLRWGVPISLVGLLLKGGLHSSNLQAALFSLMLVGCGLLLTQRAPLLQNLLPQQSQQLGAVVGNTAYFGLPVALALLPPEALSFSITYDFVGTLVTWGLGPLLLDGQRPQPRQVLNTPVVRAVLVAVPLMASPWHAALAAALWWPARLVLWLMLLLVGMRLARLLDQRLEADGLAPALLIKLLALPAAALVSCLALGWPAALRDALVLQAAAPTAMSVLLLAEASQQKSREAIPAAQLVLWSTLLALLSVPLWWWLLNQPLLQPGLQATVAM